MICPMCTMVGGRGRRARPWGIQNVLNTRMLYTVDFSLLALATPPGDDAEVSPAPVRKERQRV